MSEQAETTTGSLDSHQKDSDEARQDGAHFDQGTLILGTVSAITVLGVVAFFIGGPSLMVLVLGGSVMLLAIFALWNSVRSMTGELAVDPLLIEAQNVVVSSRSREKERILRALKDLENERDLGKLDDDDFKSVSSRYREEAKALLRQMDEDIAPYRDKAEALAKKYMEENSDVITKAKTDPAAEFEGETSTDKDDNPDARIKAKATRKAKADKREATDKLACPACGIKNDPDAKFCKSCAASMKKDTSNA
jgi:membrane protein implicated in regulation of membrane protease activity